MTEEAPFLSIVMPAFNEERRIVPSLEKIVAFLSKEPYRAQVLVVDDGSSDNTPRLVSEFARKHPSVALLTVEHGGKGHAVKAGMLAATGENRFICDADLSMPIEEISKFLPLMQQGHDIAIGSREGPGARRFDEPAHRHLLGRVSNLIIQIVALGGIDDTQCGFKCFSRRAAEEVFPQQSIKGWGFDVEVLFVARKRGFRIVEVPIHWYYMSSSKVDPLRDYYRTFRETLSIRLNDWRGQYACRKD